MSKGRVEAFSDSVLAVVITIMVLELKAPQGTDLAALRPLAPVLLAYVLSFIYIGIYWSNHHHMLHAATHVSGAALWANLHLLFWLSLVPFVTHWDEEAPEASLPSALYGVVLVMAGLAYFLLQRALIAANGKDSPLAQAVGRGRKEKISLALYIVAIGLAFVRSWLAEIIYAAVAVLWLVPDRRIERIVAGHPT
jgi:uncharacterized membrane protein